MMKVVRIYASLDEAWQARQQLREAGIPADVLDESEAEAAGGAPPEGVRLAVAEDDEPRARLLLGEGRREERLPSAQPKRGGVPWWAFVIVAVALVALAIHSDENAKLPRSGKVIEHDRNHDGRPDTRQEVSEGGHVITIYSDNNFDGVWDHVTVYRDHVLISSKWDSDFNGKFDWTATYENGIVTSAECRKDGAGPVLVRQFYQKGVITYALIDQDGDGSFDFHIDYDPYGREIRRVALK